VLTFRGSPDELGKDAPGMDAPGMDAPGMDAPGTGNGKPPPGNQATGRSSPCPFEAACRGRRERSRSASSARLGYFGRGGPG